MRKLGNKIAKIDAVDEESMSVKVRFSDGASGWVSLKHLFEKPKALSAEILRGGAFSKCFVESGALGWPNGFELCPDSLRDWFEKQNHPSKKKAA